MKWTQAANVVDGFRPAGGARRESHVLLDLALQLGPESALRSESAKLAKDAQKDLFLATVERLAFQRRNGAIAGVLVELVRTLAGRKLPWTIEQANLATLLAAEALTPADPKDPRDALMDSPVPGLLPQLLEFLEARAPEGLSPDSLEAVARLRAALAPIVFVGSNRRTLERLDELARRGAPTPTPAPGTHTWSAMVQSDVEQMAAGPRTRWQALLGNMPRGTTAKPTAAWQKSAGTRLAAVGAAAFAVRVERWFAGVGKDATDRVSLRDGALLRGLVWYAGMLEGEVICRALANLAEGGCRRLEAGGLYASSIAKACIVMLEAMPGREGAAELVRLKHRLKTPWGREEAEAALVRASERMGLPLQELEDLAVPTFELERDGCRTEPMGSWVGLIALNAQGQVECGWTMADGATLAQEPKWSKPLGLKAKSWKQLASDLQKTMQVQRSRLDRYLDRSAASGFDAWEPNFARHPLLGNLARRLIWRLAHGSERAAGWWDGDRFCDVAGTPIRWVGTGTEVSLWHPLEASEEEVMAWRLRLEAGTLPQPFKQAHREIYRPTPAEFVTAQYSNRFAGQLIRQHQFKKLCDSRGWRYEFVGAWDSVESVAIRDLPAWGLRAEFALLNSGQEFSEAGVARHVSTDQVRFFRAAQLLGVDEVPPIVFSEVMRDVDLFVSVAHTRIDPEWFDGGIERVPPEREADWNDWAFGECGESSRIRRDVLSRLIPRLKIAAQCRLEGNFLYVRGVQQEYRIHVGSGNVQIEPWHRYLCIVPARPARADARLPLPFEGDETLSVILSKAFLLARDDLIKAPDIRRQLDSRP